MKIPEEPFIPLKLQFGVNFRKNSASLPKYLTPKLAYFVGLLRDGNLNKCLRSHKVRIYQKDKKFLEEVVNSLSKHLFNKTTKIMPSGEDFVWQLDSVPLYTFFVEIFNYPKLGTQIHWTTPKLILQACREIQKWYIAGFFDAEGSICKEEGEVVIYIYHSWNNKQECPPLEDIKNMLEQFGICASGPYLYKKDKNAFRLKIRGKNVNLFFEQIPFLHKHPVFHQKEPETRWR